MVLFAFLAFHPLEDMADWSLYIYQISALCSWKMVFLPLMPIHL